MLDGRPLLDELNLRMNIMVVDNLVINIVSREMRKSSVLRKAVLSTAQSIRLLTWFESEGDYMRNERALI